MKLTKQEWEKYNKTPIKEKVDKIYEWLYSLDEEFWEYVSNQSNKEINKIINDINEYNEKVDTRCVFGAWVVIGILLMLWIYIFFLK